MNELMQLNRGLEQGLILAETRLEEMSEKTGTAGKTRFFRSEDHLFDRGQGDPSIITLGDNMEYMLWLLENGFEGKIQLIYIDPPFFTKAKYDATVELRDDRGKSRKVRHLAYDDTFERSLEYYIRNITSRLYLMKMLLSDTGSIYIHLDWHSSHYVKVVMDEIFGYSRFINEIIWKYKSGGSTKKHFSRKHDTILVYSKTDKYYFNVPKEKSYNRDFKPYRFKGVSEYQDDNGWYTLVNMKDVWSIDMVGRTSGERTGYATQKPMELMARILEASSKEGDLVADFFCGSGSFLEAAQRMGRRWIGCDTEEMAVSMAKKRISSIDGSYVCMKDVDRDDREPVKGCLKLNVVSRDELENGKSFFTFSLDKFVPQVDEGHIPLKDRSFIHDLIENDPVSLLDYIIVDPWYDQSFGAEMAVTDDFDNIRFISRGKIAFIAVDVFGKEYFYET